MNRSGRGNRGVQLNNVKTLTRQLNQLKLHVREGLNGKVIRPSADPKSVVDIPWNNATIVFESTEGGGGENILDPDGLIAAVSDTVGVPAANLLVRVQEARVWDVSGLGLRVDFFNLSNGAVFTRTVSDEPGRNQWARVGFIWPKSDQNFALQDGIHHPILAQEAAPTNQVVLHITLLWRNKGDTERKRKHALRYHSYEL